MKNQLIMVFIILSYYFKIIKKKEKIANSFKNTVQNPSLDFLFKKKEVQKINKIPEVPYHLDGNNKMLILIILIIITNKINKKGTNQI